MKMIDERRTAKKERVGRHRTLDNQVAMRGKASKAEGSDGALQVMGGLLVVVAREVAEWLTV